MISVRLPLSHEQQKFKLESMIIHSAAKEYERQAAIPKVAFSPNRLFKCRPRCYGRWGHLGCLAYCDLHSSTAAQLRLADPARVTRIEVRVETRR